MPTVPRLERTVAPGALPGARLNAALTPEAAGAGVAEAEARAAGALGNVGGAVATAGLNRMAIEAKKKREATDYANELLLLKSRKELSDHVDNTMSNPETGALNTQGEAAFSLIPTVDESVQKKADEIGQRFIKDPKLQAAWQRIALPMEEQSGLQIRQHVSRQQQKVAGDVLQATLETGITRAVNAAENPTIVAEELKVGLDALRSVGPKLGMAPEVVNQKAAEYAAGGHLAVIRKLVSGDQVGMAQEYFTKIKGELGTNVDEAQTLLKAGQNKAGAQTLSDQVLNEGGTLSEQRAKVKDRAKTADERDQALAYIEHEDALSDRAQRDALELRDRNVHDILDKAKSIKAIPASTWNQMSGNERNEAISYAKRLVEGVDVKTDVRELEKLYRQADEDPDAFTKLRLTELGFANRLSKGDMEEMLRLQHSMRTAGRKAIEKDLAPARTRDQIWTTTIQGAGIKPNTEAASMLQRRFIENVQREQTLRGKELTETEVQEQLDRLLIPVVTAPGFIWDTKKRGYELQANDVPLNDRRRLAQALRNKQQLVDPQTILELWIDEQEAKAK